MEDEYLDPEEKMWGIVFLYIAAALMAVGLVNRVVRWAVVYVTAKSKSDPHHLNDVGLIINLKRGVIHRIPVVT